MTFPREACLFREKSWETLDGRGNPGEDVPSLLYRFSEVPGKGICVAERSLLIRVGAAMNIHSCLLGRKVRDLVGVASERRRRPLLSDVEAGYSCELERTTEG